MKITVITGSPHKNGTSALLADRFIEGARESGHDVYRFNAAFEKVAPCTGCGHCRTNGAQCVHNDSMEELNPKLLEADMVVFVTPLYYFGMSAQLKTVVDRFYANNSKLMASDKKSILMFTAHDTVDWAVTSITSNYKTIARYLGWEDAGILMATGCKIRSDIERTGFPDKAYQMGREIQE